MEEHTQFQPLTRSKTNTKNHDNTRKIELSQYY